MNSSQPYDKQKVPDNEATLSDCKVELEQLRTELLYLNQTHNHAEINGMFGSYRYDFKTGKITYSDNLYRIIGCEPQEFTGGTDNFANFIHPDDIDYVAKARDEALMDKHISTWEYRLIRKDGKIINVRGTAKYIAEEGNIKYMIGTLQDITAEKVKEQKIIEAKESLELQNKKLLASEERYHRMVEEVQDYAILYLNKEGVIENWNKGAEKIKGYTAQEIIGKNFHVFYTPLDRENHLPEKLLKQALQEGTARHEGWRVRKDGSVFWGFIVITALFDDQKQVIGFSKVTRDLTSWKVAQDKIEETNIHLKNKTNQLLEAQQLAHIGSWEWEVKENRIQWSDELFRIFGLDPQEFETDYESYLRYTHPEDKEKVNRVVNQALKDHQPYNFLHRVVHPDDQVRIVSATGQVFTDNSGNINRMSGTVQDITEQKRYETELKESEERFLKIFDNNPVAMTLTQIRTKAIKYANNHFYSSFGYTKEDVIGHTSEEIKLLSKEENERIIAVILNSLHQESHSQAELQALSVEETEELLFKLKQTDATRNFEVQYTRKNGETFPALVSYEMLKIGNEKYTITSYQDITQRKKAEEQLKNQNRELEKMNKELQSFAYVSSHDLQEPLRKIQTFATRILEKEYENLSEKGKEQFNRMHNAAKRMQTLIEDLLTYSRATRSENPIFENTDLSSIVNEVKEELKEDLQQKNAIIESTKMCKVNIIPFQFRQLLHNLIGNSLKFSNPEHPPRIKIGSEIDLGIKFGNENLPPYHKYCHITISDNGIGFEPQYNEKIFEVFQRLHEKDKYKGTGIGLSIVKKIVENHNGIITAKGELNKGATFNIYIPTQ